MMAERIAAHQWCWTCGTQRGGTDGYLHHADNPVLAHDRCAVCNDVLMPYPQPTSADKLTQLGNHLNEAYRWSRVVATEEPPDDEQDLALREITQLLAQARTVYLRTLGSDHD